MRHTQVDNYIARQLEASRPHLDFNYQLFYAGAGLVIIGLILFLINLLLSILGAKGIGFGLGTAGFVIAFIGVLLAMTVYVLFGEKNRPKPADLLQTLRSMLSRTEEYNNLRAGLEGEQNIIRALNALDANYYGYSGLPLKVLDVTSGSQDIDDVVIGPTGVYAIEAKNWPGRVAFYTTTGEWSHAKEGEQPTIESSPSVEVKRGAATLKRTLGTEVKSLLVFTHQNVEMVGVAGDTDGVTVLPIGGLIDYITSTPVILDQAKVNALVNTLDVKIATGSPASGTVETSSAANDRLHTIYLVLVVLMTLLVGVVVAGVTGNSSQASGSTPTKVASTVSAKTAVAANVTPRTNGSSATAATPPTAMPTALPPTDQPPGDAIGLYRAGVFLLRTKNNTGPAEISIPYNPATSPYPVVGDWIGTGADSVGVFDRSSGTFNLCKATDAAGCADPSNTIKFTFGSPDDLPVAGRWHANSTTDGVGIFRSANGLFALRSALSAGDPDVTMVFGIPGDSALAGDWTKKGFDSPGMYRHNTGIFYLSNQVTNGTIRPDIVITYHVGNFTALASDLAVNGDWTGTGQDGIGIFRPASDAFYLRNELNAGAPEFTFNYGKSGDIPISGHWTPTNPVQPH